MAQIPPNRRPSPVTADIDDALNAAAKLGPFFVVDSWSADAGWQPLSDLITTPAVLLERVEAARVVIAELAGLPASAVEARVAASIVFLGLSARLVSPAFAAMALTGVVPQLTVQSLWWRPVPESPWPIATTPVAGRTVNIPSPHRSKVDAAPLGDAILSAVVTPVLEAFDDTFRVSRLVLWGNVASGLAGALDMLAAARPDRAEIAAGLAEQLLERPPLRGTGQLVRPDPSKLRQFFVRRSCCLFYRVPGAGMCADCVLTPEATRRQQWQDALAGYNCDL